MIKSQAIGKGAIMIFPDTAETAGLFQWLAKRFDGQNVTLEFDTTMVGQCEYYPTLWIAHVSEVKDETEGV